MVMSKVNVFEVKAKFSEYLDRALRGETVIICRHNRPVAELRAIDEIRTEPRPIGPLAGRPTFDVPPSFFEPMAPDELDLWEKGAASNAPDLSAAHGALQPSKVAERRAAYRRAGRSRRGTRRS
jgi:prevent-host-death family protein